MNRGDNIKVCPKCKSEELDIVVDSDMECRDCGAVYDINIAEALNLKIATGLPIGSTDELIPDEEEV